MQDFRQPGTLPAANESADSRPCHVPEDLNVTKIHPLHPPMRLLSSALLAGVVCLVGLLSGPVAYAQTAEMALPSIAKDRGLRSGDFLLKPSVTVTGHYDTNVFNASPSEAFLTGITPAASLRIQPRLALSNDLTGNTVFNFNAMGDGRVYLSGSQTLKNLNNFGGAAGLDVTFGQRKPLSFTLFDTFNRALRANNWETISTLNRNSNDVGARVEFHPGDTPERRPFNIAIMGAYAIDRFEDFSAFNTNTIKTRLNGSWKFLPKTAAYIDTTWDFRSYANTTLASTNLTSNTKPFRARLGASGAITKRISFDIYAGWGMALASLAATPGFNSWLGGASVGFRPTDNTRLTFGYAHDLRDAYLGAFAEQHKMYFSGKQRFGSVVDLSASVGASYLKYGAFQRTTGITVTGATDLTNGWFRRTDWQIDASVLAGFEVSRYVALQIGYNLRSIVTSFKLSSAQGLLDAGDYTAHEMFVSVVGRY